MSVSAFRSSPPVREIWILRFSTAHERPSGLLSYRYSKSQWIDRLKKLTEDLVNEIYTSGAEIEEASLNIWSARLTTRIIMASRGSLSVRETSAKHRSLFLYGGLWHFAKDTRIVWPGPWLRTRVPRIQWKVTFIKECQGIYDGLFSSFFLYFECRSLVLGSPSWSRYRFRINGSTGEKFWENALASFDQRVSLAYVLMPGHCRTPVSMENLSFFIAAEVKLYLHLRLFSDAFIPFCAWHMEKEGGKVQRVRSTIDGIFWCTLKTRSSFASSFWSRFAAALLEFHCVGFRAIQRGSSHR